jgi:hypothetical protein
MGYFKYLNWLFSLTSLAVVASALRVSYGRGAVYWSTLLLGLAFVLADLLSRQVGVEAAYPVTAGLRVLFFSQVIIVIMIDIMKSKVVSMETVLGASCIFIMIGLTFGSAYILIDWITPGAFHLPDLSNTAGGDFSKQTIEFQLIYFSLVTMTTVGYGDILPIASSARALASFEGLVSQLFLTIIIARLVGLEIATRLQKSNPNE